MQLVALFSGGKDSVHTLYHAVRHGHEVVGLANLLPESAADDDVDSWMYQTVGHGLVPALGECLGLPVYRKRTRAKAANQKLQYARTAGDEVEDLAGAWRPEEPPSPHAATA